MSDSAGDKTKGTTEVDFGELLKGGQPLRRLVDFVRESLAKADGLAANLGVINAQLMSLTLQLSQWCHAALQPELAESLDADQLWHVLEMVLRLNKQIDRYIQLDLRLRERSDKLARCKESAGDTGEGAT